MLRRALHNAGFLLGGKVASGVMQLATFAIAARALGVSEFGYFSVMLAQIQLLITVATFQSNQAIVRYGVIHLGNDDRPAFQSLVRFGTMLDLSAAVVAVALALLVGPWLLAGVGWDQRLLDSARWLAFLPLTLALATPRGILRLFDRFDLLSVHVAVTPLLRLVGAVVVAQTGSGLFGFVVVWLVAGIGGVVVAVALAWRELVRRELVAGMRWSPAGAARLNPGIWRFAFAANLHSSLNLVPGHLSVFAVGLVLGPPAAGLMKVAQELGSAFAKPVDLVNQTVYPDLARLAAARSWARVRRLVVRAGAAASALSLTITVLLIPFGRPLIGLVFGPEFAGAQPVLVMVSLGTTLSVAVFAVEPALYAVGRPGLPLLSAILSFTLFVTTLFFGLPLLGIEAAGAAYIVAAAATIGCGLIWMRRMFGSAGKRGAERHA